MASMNPKPSVVMSIVVKTEVYPGRMKGAGSARCWDRQLPVACSTHLVVYGIDDIDGLHDKDQPHARSDVGESTESDALLAQASDVEHEPKDETGTELVELLDVELGEAGRSRVKGSTHEELATESSVTGCVLDVDCRPTS